MSNLASSLVLDLPANVTPIRPALAPLAEPEPLPASRPAAASAPAAPAAPSTQTAAETRGFALYIGLDESKAELDGTSLTELVTELRRLAAQLAPHATTHASVALAPQGAGGRDVDVVRLALGDRQALAERRAAEERERAQLAGHRARVDREEGIEGVTIDTTRQRVLIDGENAHVTFTEFELVQALVLREGRAVSRDELIEVVWRPEEGARPTDRTIDVHIRRLRAKLGEYADIVRTVRGSGYRFDRHADVEVLRAPNRSPERF